MAVVLIATLDTKGRELAFVRDILRLRGLETIVIDAGSVGEPTIEADILRSQVFRDSPIPTDRGEAVSLVAEGVASIVLDLDRSGRVDGVFALGGSAGTVIGTAAMRALPFGRPKVMVSTLASGQVQPFVGGSDIAMFHPVADLAGLNRLTMTALSNAAHAMIGMVSAPVLSMPNTSKIIAATMFGVTTPCVDRARSGLEKAGFEVIVFHATGIGGRSMEGLIRDGQVDAVLDLTTTEMADELVGGILSAGPDRMMAAIRAGIPQVVSVGALDMVNFGPRETVPERFEGRTFHVHNPSVTLMRTSLIENFSLGRRMASALRQATSPVIVLLPLRGISALDATGMPFHDDHADSTLFAQLQIGLRDTKMVEVVERDEHINDPSFADYAAFRLRELIEATER